MNGRSSRMPAWVRPARVADVRADGVTVWTGTQKPHFAAQGVAGVSGRAGGKGARHLGDGPGLLWPQRCGRRRPWTRP